MKKFLIICLSVVFIAIGTEKTFAQNSWTIETVPNTRLESDEIHVSDPDGFLSDSAEIRINTALCAIRNQADVFVVTLATIGSNDPKHFATGLFNYWGIGDAETNNGVLLLFVEDQHALEFETGYGAEETLTDAKCERIFRNTIVPFFKAGDYEGGLCAGVADIVEVYGGTVPVGLKTTLPSNIGNSDSDSSLEEYGTLTIIVFMLIFIMPIVALVYWVKKRREKTMGKDTYRMNTENGVTYLESTGTSWSGSPWEGKGCLGALMLGFSIFLFFFPVFVFVSMKFPDMPDRSQFDWSALITLVLYLTWICFRQGRRTLKVADALAKQSVNPMEVYLAASKHTANKIAFWMAPWLGWVYHKKLKARIEEGVGCQCPICGVNMKKDRSFALPEVHALENRIGALSFHPYRCFNGHTIVMKEKGRQYSNFSTCSKCGAFAVKETHTETIREADYSHNGEKVVTSVCQYCGEIIKKTVVIPKLVHYTSSSSYSSSSSSRSYSSSSSHSSGGSFGGGRSGGGGYSGRW